MRIDWKISSENKQSTLIAIGGQNQGYSIPDNDLCWAAISVHDRGGRTHDFGEIAALSFFSNLVLFLDRNKEKEFAREHLSDFQYGAPQRYEFKLEKEGALLTLKVPPYAHPTLLRFDFEQARTKARHYGGLFLREYLQKCPALRQYKYLSTYQSAFNLQP